MRQITFVLALVFLLMPAPARAKQTLGVLHLGSSVMNFTLAGNTVVVEQQDAGGTRDDIQIATKDLDCTSIGPNTLTLRARGLKTRRSQTSKGDVLYTNFQKAGSRAYVFNKSEQLAAFALAAKLNRLAHCK